MDVLDASRSRLSSCAGSGTVDSPTPGAQWHMLPLKLSELQNCASRRFQTWCCHEIFASGFLTDVCQRASRQRRAG